MELELGLKLARVADEFTSADLHILKDHAGPLFLSAETETLFIVTAHLRGYKKDNVKIDINEDGTQIAVSGEKAIQETVFVGWKLYKKETEVRGFRKAFKIPDGVILDKIKAKFDEDECVLTVSMPKKEKGIRGFIIEEVKDQDAAKGASETLQIADDHREKGKKQVDHAQETKEADGKSAYTPPTARGEELEQNLENVEKLPVTKDVEYLEETQRQKSDCVEIIEKEKKEQQEAPSDRPVKKPENHEKVIKDLPNEHIQVSTVEAEIIESHIEEHEHVKENIPQESDGKLKAEDIKNNQNTFLKKDTDEEHRESDQIHDNAEEGQVKSSEEDQAGRPLGSKEEKGRFNICVPAIAGSAFLLSLVVFVITYIRKRSEPGKRKE